MKSTGEGASWIVSAIGRSLVYLLLSTLVLSGIGAEDSNPGSQKPWQPPPPAPDDFDWIQLVSGEWLKGEFKYLQDGKVEFDSEELDLLTFDWEDIAQVRIAKPSTAMFEDKSVEVGPLRITKETIRILGEEENTFPRTELQAITAGEPHEINAWSGKASIGISVRSGNTDQTDFTTKLKLLRRTPSTRYALEYLGNTGSLDGEENINNHRVSSYFDWFYTTKLFLRPVFGEFFSDKFQNISYRVTAGTGLGYRIYDKPKLEWNVAGGPAAQWTRFRSVEAGDDINPQTPALVAGTNYEVELNRRLDLILDYQGQWTSDETGLFTQHGQVTLEVEMNRYLDLDVSLVWDRIERPARDSDGDLPKKDDLRLTVGISFEL